MLSREKILERVKANKPKLIDLPAIDVSIFNEDKDIIEEFTKKVEIVGGNVLQVNDIDEILDYVNLHFDGKVKFSTLENTYEYNTIDIKALQRPQDLSNLDVLILESELGVSENGAVWLTDKEIPVRVLPFIVKHLIIVLKKCSLVPYMHQAYAKIGSSDYGVFISGPSKTADIEQSLVIGAHGALSLNVFLLP